METAQSGAQWVEGEGGGSCVLLTHSQTVHRRDATPVVPHSALRCPTLGSSRLATESSIWISLTFPATNQPIFPDFKRNLISRTTENQLNHKIID